MKDLVLRIRFPQKTETDGHAIRNYKLDQNVYNIAKAQAQVNYSLRRNVPVMFMLDVPPKPFEMRGGKVVEDYTVREIVFNPMDMIPTNPKLGGGAVSLMFEEPGSAWESE